MKRTRAIVGGSLERVGRHGFTLIELLITITIILLLAGISVPVIGGMLANARKAATATTIKKVDELLKTRIAAFNGFVDEQVRDRRSGATVVLQGPKTKQLVFTADPFITFGTAPRNFAKLAGYSPMPLTDNAVIAQRAMVLARKGLFRKYFPQNWAEVRQHGWPGQVGITPPATVNPTTESGEVLYLMFTKLGIPGFGDDAADVLLPVEVVDTDGNGFPELVDSWGRPLRFYRWPTSLFRMAAGDAAYRADATSAALSMVSGYASKKTLAGALNKDLDDPRRMIPAAGFPGVTPTTFANTFHTISTFSLPLVVSAGLDGSLGLKEPGDTTAPATTSGRLGFTLVDATDGSLTAAQAAGLEDIFDNMTNLNATAGRTR